MAWRCSLRASVRKRFKSCRPGRSIGQPDQIIDVQRQRHKDAGDDMRSCFRRLFCQRGLQSLGDRQTLDRGVRWPSRLRPSRHALYRCYYWHCPRTRLRNFTTSIVALQLKIRQTKNPSKCSYRRSITKVSCWTWRSLFAELFYLPHRIKPHEIAHLTPGHFQASWAGRRPPQEHFATLVDGRARLDIAQQLQAVKSAV